MSHSAIDRAVTELFHNPSRQTRNIKYYFRSNSTAEQLADYRNRVTAQIRSGVALLDETLDSELLD